MSLPIIFNGRAVTSAPLGARKTLTQTLGPMTTCSPMPTRSAACIYDIGLKRFRQLHGWKYLCRVCQKQVQVLVRGSFPIFCRSLRAVSYFGALSAKMTQENLDF